jgi:glycerol-3-phosphate dehydrogenase
MKRNPEQIANTHYDIIVIGGGINGIATAYEAALRGMKTCLIEASDFMSQTSSNSLKIIHGGFRYLQQANLKRIRESSRERRTLLKIAPHLVHPLQCVMPTESIWNLRSLPGMFAASLINGLIAFDRSKGLPKDKQIFLGGIISKQKTIHLLGKEFDQPSVTGAAVWYDGMAINSERIGFSFLHSGEKKGLDAINYCPAAGFLLHDRKITGVKVNDLIQKKEFVISGDFIINAAGAWAGGLLNLLPSSSTNLAPQCRVMNLVTKRTLFSSNQAVGLFDKDRAFFFVPWRGYWMIGTDESEWHEEPNKLRVTEEDIQRFLLKINKVYPGKPISREDICYVHKGLVPGQPKPEGDFKLFDHQKDGINNLFSLQPVKYTTARDIAQKTVDSYFNKTGKPFQISESAELSLEGGEMESFSSFYAEHIQKVAALVGERAARHLLYSYGSSYGSILQYADLLKPVSGSDEVLQAEIAYAVEEEMAQTLPDAILRRTDLGSAEQPKMETLAHCAALMGKMLGWSKEQQEEEIARCAELYRQKDC